MNGYFVKPGNGFGGSWVSKRQQDIYMMYPRKHTQKTHTQTHKYRWEHKISLLAQSNTRCEVFAALKIHNHSADKAFFKTHEFPFVRL